MKDPNKVSRVVLLVFSLAVVTVCSLMSGWALRNEPLLLFLLIPVLLAYVFFVVLFSKGDEK